MMGALVIVPTPIGNLEDMTLRAIRTLKEADIVLAEDTRTSRILLTKYHIETKLRAYHRYNEHQIVQQIVAELLRGATYALVSDAGTPGISDPGFLLVRAAIKNQIEVTCLPGPTAFLPALVHSGFPCDKFVYEGFLPHKKGRRTAIQRIASEQKTVVIYESPHRIVKLLHQLREVVDAERKVAVCRELTKKFEETLRGTPSELIHHFDCHPPRGEFVVVIEGRTAD